MTRVTEEEIAAVAVGPRVTQDRINSLVEKQEWWNPSICPHMTICALRLKNGFVVIGQSAPADPDNFDSGLGARLAREDALKKVWELEGYLLREKLHGNE